MRLPCALEHLAPLFVAVTLLLGCGGEDTGGSDGGAGGTGTTTTGTGGTTTTTPTELPKAQCKEGNIVIEGTLDGQALTIDLASGPWDYKGPGASFIVSFDGGSVGLNPVISTATEDKGNIAVTGGIDIPAGMPFGADIVCADQATLIVCDGGGLDSCGGTYQFDFALTTITRTTGGTCAVGPSKKKAIAGQLAGCLLITP